MKMKNLRTVHTKKMASDSILSPNYNERQWVAQISENFTNQDALEVGEIPISVCNVPKSISVVKPEAYTPQVVALGPYHHLEDELYQMERFKLAAVKSFLKPDQISNFQVLVIDKLKKMDLTIRACYHKYLKFDDDTLAWIVAIDGIFLLFLLSNLTETYDAPLYRDVMMLENQIPSIILREIRETLKISISKDEGDDALFTMMRDFVEAQSPFELAQKTKSFKENSGLHLLELLYRSIVSNPIKFKPSSPVKEDSVSLDIDPKGLADNINEIFEIGSSLPIKETRVLKNFQFVEKIPWGMIYNLLGLRLGIKNRPVSPTVTEINIPSVSHLVHAGRIKFCPAYGGINKVYFDEVLATLYLPVITLNSNSEVIIRNLVAYEVASTPTFQLAQYVDLISGIIDTTEDVKLLKSAGIIKGSLTNAHVADLFNGMNKCSGDGYSETIRKINKYFDKRPKVEVFRFARDRVYASWKFLTVASTILLLLLLTLQSFCDVYGCTEFFGSTKLVSTIPTALSFPDNRELLQWIFNDQ